MLDSGRRRRNRKTRAREMERRESRSLDGSRARPAKQATGMISLLAAELVVEIGDCGVAKGVQEFGDDGV